MPIAEKLSLKALVDRLGFGGTAGISAALFERRVLAPPDHSSDPAHLIVTGTGLPHPGAATLSPVPVSAL